MREDFKTDADLYHFLNSMSEAEYQKYLGAAQEFFKSPEAEKFSIASFVNRIVTMLFDK